MPEPDFLTVAQVAARLGVGETTIWREIAEGALPSVKIRAQRRIAKTALAAYLRRNSHVVDDAPDGNQGTPEVREIGGTYGRGDASLDTASGRRHVLVRELVDAGVGVGEKRRIHEGLVRPGVDRPYELDEPWGGTEAHLAPQPGDPPDVVAEKRTALRLKHLEEAPRCEGLTEMPTRNPMTGRYSG